MSVPSPSKKAAAVETEILQLQSKLLLPSDGDSSPIVLGHFPGVNVSDTANFKIYRSKSTGKTLIHGDSDKIEYDGITEPDSNQYCIAIYDEKSKSVQLVPTTLVSFSSIVKSKKRLRGPAIRQSNVRNNIQRTALGEAFGTKKAKKAISDLERNRIDADKLQDLEVAIVDTVKTSTENLPSQEKIQQTLTLERPIPPYNLETTELENVYPVINGLMTKKEYEALRVATSIVNEKDETKRMAMFPHKNSEYIHSRLKVVLAEPGSASTRTHKVKILYYASLLLAVYDNRRISSKAALMAKLDNPAEILISGVLDRFAVPKAGSFGKSKDRNFVIDPVHENKLLCYFLVAALHIDNFLVQISPLAQELSLKPSKVADLFKAIGCNVKPISSTQAEALGIKKSLISAYKAASLKAPLRLPEVAKRKRAGGQR